MGGEDASKSASPEKEGRKNEGGSTVPFHRLFAFADSVDQMLMIAGSIGAVGNGLCMPLMTILFGELIDSFGQNQTDDDVVDVVSKVCNLFFVYASYDNHFLWNFYMCYIFVLHLVSFLGCRLHLSSCIWLWDAE